MSRDHRAITRAFIVAISLQHLAMGWFSGTYVLFLLEHRLTLFDANLLNFAFMTTSFVLDPLTGLLADRFGQKRTYVAGQAAWAASMLIYGTGSHFGQFLAAELTGSLGHCLMSGSLDSWVRNHVGEKHAHHAIARSGVVSRLASIPTAILGSIVGAILGFEWPWILAGISAGITSVVVFLLLRPLPESYAHPETAPTLSGTALHTLTNRSLRFTLVIAFSFVLLLQPLNMFWTPVLRDMSGQAWWLGGFWAGIGVATALGAHLARGR